MSRAERWLLIIGSVLVVIGCGGEYIFGGRAANIAAQLQQSSDEVVAGLQAKAAEANVALEHFQNESA